MADLPRIEDPQAFLDARGYHPSDVSPDFLRDLGDGTFILVHRKLFHYSMLRGAIDNIDYHFDHWCYPTLLDALTALYKWPVPAPDDYEPTGWHRHPNTGRRRKDADPEREYLDSDPYPVQLQKAKVRSGSEL